IDARIADRPVDQRGQERARHAGVETIVPLHRRLEKVIRLNHGSSIRTVWIIGPPCAGKTTLARLLVARLRENGRAAMLLDGDEIRAVFENQLGFDPASRRKQTARVLRLARWVIRQDIIPVVAIIHPFADDRAMCRDSVPGYFEVYLKCDMKERIRRDTKKLYLP